MIELILSISVLAFLLTLLSSPEIGDRDLSDDESGAKIIGGIITITALKKAGIIGGIALAGAGAYSYTRTLVGDTDRTLTNGDGTTNGEGVEGLEAMLEMIMELLPVVFIGFIALFGLMFVVQIIRSFSN